MRFNGYNSRDPSVLSNFVNPHIFSWDDLLDEIYASGYEVASVFFANWLQMLKKSAMRGDEARNPAVKLIGYFEPNSGGVEEYYGCKGHVRIDGCAEE